MSIVESRLCVVQVNVCGVGQSERGGQCREIRGHKLADPPPTAGGYRADTGPHTAHAAAP